MSRRIQRVWDCPRKMHSLGINGEGESRGNWPAQVHLEKLPLLWRMSRLDAKTLQGHERYRIMVDSNWADVSSTDSTERYEAILPFTDVHNSLIHTQQVRNVFGTVWTDTQQQTCTGLTEHILLQILSTSLSITSALAKRLACWF